MKTSQRSFTTGKQEHDVLLLLLLQSHNQQQLFTTVRERCESHKPWRTGAGRLSHPPSSLTPLEFYEAWLLNKIWCGKQFTQKLLYLSVTFILLIALVSNAWFSQLHPYSVAERHECPSEKRGMVRGFVWGALVFPSFRFQDALIYFLWNVSTSQVTFLHYQSCSFGLNSLKVAPISPAGLKRISWALSLPLLPTQWYIYQSWLTDLCVQLLIAPTPLVLFRLACKSNVAALKHWMEACMEPPLVWSHGL